MNAERCWRLEAGLECDAHGPGAWAELPRDRASPSEPATSRPNGGDERHGDEFPFLRERRAHPAVLEACVVKTLTREDAKVAVAFLNEALKLDPVAVQGLFEHRVPCNDALRDHPTIQVAAAGAEPVPGEPARDQASVGILGLLNGLFGVDERSWGHIAACWDVESGTLLRFELVGRQF